MDKELYKGYTTGSEYNSDFRTQPDESNHNLSCLTCRLCSTKIYNKLNKFWHIFIYFTL